MQLVSVLGDVLLDVRELEVGQVDELVGPIRLAFSSLISPTTCCASACFAAIAGEGALIAGTAETSAVISAISPKNPSSAYGACPRLGLMTILEPLTGRAHR